MVKVTCGHVLLSSHTTRTADSLCSLQDDGTQEHHHTTVSCSKVCVRIAQHPVKVKWIKIGESSVRIVTLFIHSSFITSKAAHKNRDYN